MKWITRERPKIDRIACPWLIVNFIDPGVPAAPLALRGSLKITYDFALSFLYERLPV